MGPRKTEVGPTLVDVRERSLTSNGPSAVVESPPPISRQVLRHDSGYANWGRPSRASARRSRLSFPTVASHLALMRNAA
jgi:hypothetical protein